MIKIIINKILLTVSIISTFYFRCYALDIKWNDSQAKVSYVHQREYYNVMLELIHKAKKSIVISMYLIDNAKRGDEPIVSNLCEALVKAKNRNVKVKVILGVP